MDQLDGRTLESLAELICGDDGPLYRRGWELPLFFRRAGLECPDHDGGPRKRWVLDRLEAITRDPAAVEALVRRLADPREYQGVEAVHSQALDELNRVLAPEGLRVVLDGTRPSVQEKSAQPLASAPKDPPHLHALSNDSILVGLLYTRWSEVERCLEVGAHLSGLVMMGSLLEGALYAAVTHRGADAERSPSVPKDRMTGRALPFSQWSLSDLINVAHERGWIHTDVRDFSHVLREYRNLVHPAKQRQTKISPDQDTCAICWEVVRAAINDLTQSA